MLPGACFDRCLPACLPVYLPARLPACPQVPVELIPWRAIRQGRRLGQGSEGAVLEAVYRDAPVAVKEGASEAEIDMFLSAGTHDNLVGLRGLTQKV